MARLLLIAIAAVVAGCGGIPKPGMTTSQLESDMGVAAEKRVQPDGETWYYYPKQPHGLAMWVARVDKEGRVLAVEQRLTDENLAVLEKGKGTLDADQVHNLIGPPWKVWPFPRMKRDIWEYRMILPAGGNVPQGLYVQMSPDNVVREVYLLSDPDNRLSECCAR